LDAAMRCELLYEREPGVAVPQHCHAIGSLRRRAKGCINARSPE
jgi:hypothetical protein